VTLTDRLLLIADELAHAEALIEDLAAENARLRQGLATAARRAPAPPGDRAGAATAIGAKHR